MTAKETTNSIDVVKRQQSAALGEAKAEYRQLLARADAPKPGDPDKLIELMRTLGKSAGDLDRDRRIAAKVQELEDVIRTENRVRREHEAIAKQAADYAIESRRILDERENTQAEIDSKLVGTQVKLDAIRRAKTDLARLEKQHRDLFG